MNERHEEPMTLTRVQRYLKAIDDVAKCKGEKRGRAFKRNVLEDSIRNLPDFLNEEDTKLLREALEACENEETT